MRFFLALAAVVLGMIVVAEAGSTVLLRQTVSVPGAKATATVGRDIQRPGYRVDIVFKISPGSPLDPECLSIYRDVQYDLRDANNHWMPVNKAAMRRSVEMEYSIAEGHSPTPDDRVLPSRAPCSNHFGGEAGRYVDLDELYPHLAPGGYTLYMSFAPRGISQRASFKPLRITVDSQHPI